MTTKRIALQGPAKPCPDALLACPMSMSGGMA